MILFKQVADIHTYLEKQGKKALQTGFVPTMGALHQGHLSLIKESKKENGTTVCSIFVNPTQFNDPKDFEKYPTTIEQDIYQLETAGCDILFLPGVAEMYPDGTATTKHYELGYLENILEGKYRPGHFQGVCQVVDRLLQIVQPDNLYIGQKDYQQCMVIKKLVDIMGIQTTVHICATLREANGLAMSSRNMRLNDAEREQAAELFKTLTVIKDTIRKEAIADIKANAMLYLSGKGFKPDYIELADATTLEPIIDPIAIGWNGQTSVVALIAAFLNEVRLIDNIIIE
jgi:pantoate--beta-alanine ligase